MSDAPSESQPSTPFGWASPASVIVMITYLVVASGVVTFLVVKQLRQLNDENTKEFATEWRLPNGMELASMPPGFRYDAEEHRLIHRGTISATRVLQLRELLTVAPKRLPCSTGDTDGGVVEPGAVEPGVVEPGVVEDVEVAGAGAVAQQPAGGAVAGLVEAQRAYHQALGELTSLAYPRVGAELELLLILALLGGTLGALLRSLTDLVGNACYRRQLDLKRWWPLYVTRPVVGGILGFVIVVMFKARLFTAVADARPDGSLWWLGVAVLGGFSTIDVTARLRLGAKALFGVDGPAKS